MALTLYYLIGGEIELLGQKLNDIPVAEPLAWIAILFFLWRHWVHAKNDRAASRDLVANACRESRKLTAVGQALLIESVSNAAGDDNHPAMQAAKDSRVQIKWLVSWFSYNCQSNQGSVSGVSLNEVLPVPWKKVAPSAWAFRVRLSLTTNYIDPWLPYAAPLLALSAYKWGDAIASGVKSLV